MRRCSAPKFPFKAPRGGRGTRRNAVRRPPPAKAGANDQDAGLVVPLLQPVDVVAGRVRFSMRLDMGVRRDDGGRGDGEGAGPRVAVAAPLQGAAAVAEVGRGGSGRAVLHMGGLANRHADLVIFELASAAWPGPAGAPAPTGGSPWCGTTTGRCWWMSNWTSHRWAMASSRHERWPCPQATKRRRCWRGGLRVRGTRRRSVPAKAKRWRSNSAGCTMSPTRWWQSRWPHRRGERRSEPS